MAKKGSNKLTKLKSAIKQWASFSKLTRSTSSITNSSSTSSDVTLEEDKNSKLHSVFVGKSRRRYLLSSDVVFHPLFQELIERSSGVEEGREDLVVENCEVVLFEHLLWMLQGGGSHSLIGSMQELAEFYFSS